MKEELISFETTKLAKEKKYDINLLEGSYVLEKEGYVHIVNKNYPTFKNKERDYYFIDNPQIYLRPTQSLLQRWLREKKNVDIQITPYLTSKGLEGYKYSIFLLFHNGTNFDCKGTVNTNLIHSYELALEAALYDALNLI